MDQFSRTELIIGDAALDKLKHSSVIVFGVGGVGSYAAESLARCGIGKIGLVDDDVVCITNANRQLIALSSTVGQMKTSVMSSRILDINPAATVVEHNLFYGPDTIEDIDLCEYDYIIDAIDTVTGKLTLIERALECGIPVISCMGAGNKLDPMAFKVTDISKTSYCPLAKIMRKELRARGIHSGVKVVYSEEEVIPPHETEETSCKYACVCPPDSARNCTERRQVPGSISFVPAAAGLLCASEAVKDLIAGV